MANHVVPELLRFLLRVFNLPSAGLPARRLCSATGAHGTHQEAHLPSHADFTM